MTDSLQDTLLHYLQTARDAVLWKLEGVGEYDVRRPLTPTGTNLLGVVKHLASVELGYFVLSFGRDLPVAMPWWDELDSDPHADLVATPEETREEILDLYRLAWRETDRTVAEVGLDGEGRVPWWPAERNPVTVRLLLVHVLAETHRHAGHLDILRETLDGAAGLRPDASNLPGDDYDWEAHVARVEEVARRFR